MPVVSEAQMNICTVSSLNVSSPEDQLRQCTDELAIRYLPVMLYMFVLLFTGFVGNILVIIVFVRKTPRSSTHYFIINLAALDLLTVIIGMPTEIADLRYSLMFYASAACKILRTVETLSAMGSTVILLTVAIDRYHRICKYGMKMTNVKAKRICYISWLIGLFTCWPAAIVFGRNTKEVGINGLKAVDCSTDDSMKGTKYPLAYYCSLFLYFIVSVVFVTVVYTKIVLLSRKTKRSLSLSISPSMKNKYSLNNLKGTSISNNVKVNVPDQIPNVHQNKEIANQEPAFPKKSIKTKSQISISKTTTTLGVVTVVFILSFLPYLVVMATRNIIKNFEDLLNPSSEVLYKLCLKSYFLNNAINPVIYSFLNSQFRKDVKDLIHQL